MHEGAGHNDRLETKPVLSLVGSMALICVSILVIPFGRTLS
jgi:hypothetical protein